VLCTAGGLLKEAKACCKQCDETGGGTSITENAAVSTLALLPAAAATRRRARVPGAVHSSDRILPSWPEFIGTPVCCFDRRLLSRRSMFIGTPVHCFDANALPLLYWQRYTQVCTLLDMFAILSAVVSMHRSSKTLRAHRLSLARHQSLHACTTALFALDHAHFSLVTQCVNVCIILLHCVYH
jgi:hypothetical protein